MVQVSFTSINAPTGKRQSNTNAKTSIPIAQQARQCLLVEPAAIAASPQAVAAALEISTSLTPVRSIGMVPTTSRPLCNTEPTPLHSREPTRSSQPLRESSSQPQTQPAQARATLTGSASFTVHNVQGLLRVALLGARRPVRLSMFATSLRCAIAILRRLVAMRRNSTRLAWRSVPNVQPWIAILCASS